MSSSKPILIILALAFTVVVFTELVKAILQISLAIMMALSSTIFNVLLNGIWAFLFCLLNVVILLGLCFYDITLCLVFIFATLGPLIAGFFFLRGFLMGMGPLRSPEGGY
ncbi:uncharacterized protein F4817DRAFT_142570 [Daldinia loculata]|uniref:uncharacterized protein n=1 Tax=Daldinia loculata TaxID=103429 RepID=UPI0020C3E36F|nr:uncharacterized protein F4817DRAFT_142570 [Daldinia loculata]KAI1646522.1 hypothetical protein F4817DRAFT_142570 [Daldinia loculata]